MRIRRGVVLVALLIGLLLVGCNRRIGDYAAVSSFSKDGFAKGARHVKAVNGRELAVWGYVDYGNIYGDAAARSILGQWWSGDGPDSSTWAFNVKAGPDVSAGRSFQVRVPNDSGRDALLQAIADNATAGRPTQVFLRGKMLTFDAPVNGAMRTGLRMQVQSSSDISLQAPAER
jgi:hypothetical protein